jgi:hypothetical protein
MGEVGRARGCFRFPRKGELLALSAALEGATQRMASEMGDTAGASQTSNGYPVCGPSLHGR